MADFVITRYYILSCQPDISRVKVGSGKAIAMER